MAKIDASYTKTAGPDGMRFHIVPASSPDAGFSLSRLLLCLIPAMVFSSIVSGVLAAVFGTLLGAMGIGATLGLLIMIPTWAAFLFGWYTSYRWLGRWLLDKQAKSRHAYEVDLLVNAAGVTVSGTGQFLRREDMHRFVIKNAFDDSYEVPLNGFVAVGSPMAVGVASAANAMTNSMAMLANHKRRMAARVGFIVTIEAGGVAHPIAGGLTEVCAHGVMTDIGRSLESRAA